MVRVSAHHCARELLLLDALPTSASNYHEQLELFPKRAFNYNYPIAPIPHPCGLHTVTEVVNVENVYGQNFKGDFCRCGVPQDVKSEMDAMVQCVACEVRCYAFSIRVTRADIFYLQDWFHETCLNLREHVSPRSLNTENQLTAQPPRPLSENADIPSTSVSTLVEFFPSVIEGMGTIWPRLERFAFYRRRAFTATGSRRVSTR